MANTHHHGDHTFGTCLFDGATIVADERCRTEVLAGGLRGYQGIWDDVEWGTIEIARPFSPTRDR